MLRATNWITSLTIGLAVACEASLLFAAGQPQEHEPTPAEAKASRPVDYVADLPADDESHTDGSYNSDLYAAPQPLETEADVAPGAGEGAVADDEIETIKERFPNGSVRIERQVTQDALGNYLNHGTWKMWDERGNLLAQGQYEYGNRTGEWIRWYRSPSEASILTKPPYAQFAGPFISQATFKNDQLDGHWTIYDGKTHKISQWTFEDGKRNGPSVWWYANGKKMRKAQFVNGDMDGAYLEWAPDGSLKVKESYESGRRLAIKTAYHKGNVKKSEGMYLFAKDVEHAPDDWWNCKLVTTVKTGKDEKHGAWTSWFPSGQKQLEGAYEHDLQVGKFTWWHSNGQRALEGKFTAGKQDGEWTWWHANGQKSIQGEYAHGNPTGRWTWWKEDGHVVQSADLSQSEGVVIETPRQLETPQVPRLSTPTRRQPVKR